MGIDLKKIESNFKVDSGFWCTYPEDEEVELKIRPLYPDKAQQLTKKATRKSRNGTKEVDQDKLSRLTIEYVIEDFKGISIDGKEECNTEALDLLQKYCGDIVRFALAKSSEFAEAIALNQKEQLKN